MSKKAYFILDDDDLLQEGDEAVDFIGDAPYWSPVPEELWGCYVNRCQIDFCLVRREVKRG